MLDLTPEQAAALEEQEISVVSAVSMWFESQTQATGFIRWTDAPGGLTLVRQDANGNDVDIVHSATNNMMVGVEPPDAQNEASRDLFGLQWYDPDGAYERAFDGQGYIGVNIEVNARLTAGSQVIDMTFFRGKSVGLTTEFTDEGRVLSMTFAGPLAKFDADYSMTTSQADQAERDADDDCFDYAHDAQDFEWGQPTGGFS